MQNTKTLRRHAGLVDQMSNALDIDLEEKALQGKISISEIDDAVLRCTGCSHPNDCEHWLATRESVEDKTPSYCRNSDLFAVLKHS